ncbi:MAG: hypothetical protein MI974_28930 [Chitinophagales bacterium]|nr:hypothetical protein [Chitinophagales bacterium]
MKRFFIAALIVLGATLAYSQNNAPSIILNKFIEANNSGTANAFSTFVKETYEPGLYNKIDVQKHIDFYAMIQNDFGKLKPLVYKQVEETPHRLVVLLIKEHESLSNKNIDPTEILMVEIDLNQQNPKYLGRALGLGALACELKKK